MRITAYLLISIVLLTIPLINPQPTQASDVYEVPFDYPDIQTAISLVPPGSTILVYTDQFINTPISIVSKNILNIIFINSKIYVSAGYSFTEIIDIDDSTGIRLYNVEVVINNPAMGWLSVVSIDSSNNTLLSVFKLAQAGPINSNLLVVYIIGASRNLSIVGMTIDNMLLNGYLEVVRPIGLQPNNMLVLKNIVVNNVTSLTSRIYGLAISFQNIIENSIVLDNVIFNNIYAGGGAAFLLEIGGFWSVENTSVEIRNISYNDVTAIFWPEAINIWSIFGVWNNSNLTIENVEIKRIKPLSGGYVGIWINLGNYQNARVVISDVNIIDARPGTLFGNGLAVNFGWDFGYVVRENAVLNLRNVYIDRATVGVILKTGNILGVNNKDVYANISDIYVKNVDTGFLLELWRLVNYKIWINNYTMANRTPSTGLIVTGGGISTDMHPGPDERSLEDIISSEDLLISYSLIWSMDLDVSGPQTNMTIYESVVDEFNSVYDNDLLVRQIWTLNTIVLSSYTHYPVVGAVVDVKYPSPTLYDSGYSRLDGYPSVMDYYLLSSQADDISVEARLFGRSASTSLPSYLTLTYGEPFPYNIYSFPSWYGDVILMLDVLSLEAIGFSHDGGLTILTLYGKRGGFEVYFSDNPMDRSQTPYVYYPLWVKKVYQGSVYTVVKADILYLGQLQESVIYIYWKKNVIWSPGPIDFRGWIWIDT